jgi:hypothetical protein
MYFKEAQRELEIRNVNEARFMSRRKIIHIDISIYIKFNTHTYILYLLGKNTIITHLPHIMKIFHQQKVEVIDVPLSILPS